MKCCLRVRVVRAAVMSLWLAVVATSLAAAAAAVEDHCSLAQGLEEGAVLFEPPPPPPRQDVLVHHPESDHATTNAAEPRQAQKPGRLTEQQQKREQGQALKEWVVAFMRAQEQAFDELEANNDNDAGEPEFDPVLGDMQLKMAQLAQQEQEDPRLRLDHAHSAPVPADKEKEEKAKGQKKVGWGGSLEVPARGMESRGSWSWGWSKPSSQGGGGGKVTTRPRADS